MRSSFSRCGRYAFARGNSAWARSFNFSLHSARGTIPTSFASAPFAWRMLASASPMMSNAVGVMMAASESPASVGFAEQAGCIQAGMLCNTESSTDEVAESGDDTANVLSSAPAGSHITLLKSMSDVIVFGTNTSICNMKCYHMTVSHYSETRELHVPIPSRPILVAKANSMQSRLSQLAAALSPSHSVTPVSRRESPTPMTSSASPIVNRRVSFDSEEPLSRSVQHYPIDTPPFEFEDDPNVLVDEAKLELEKYWTSFQAKSQRLIDELRFENDRKEALKAEILAESTKREEAMLNEILAVIETRTEFKIAKEVEKRRILEMNKLEEVRNELYRIEMEKKESENSNDCILSTLLESIELKIHDQLSRTRQTNLFEENLKLKSSIRKMKICLSKWRIDYMQYAQDLAKDKAPMIVKQVVKEKVADEQFSKHSQNLAKLWTACGPSNQQLVKFLNQIELAVNNGTNISDVYKNECVKIVEKLPLAQLIAKREFLLAKSNTTPSQRRELEELTYGISSSISEYEKIHSHSFVYDGQDYGKNLDSLQLRDS